MPIQSITKHPQSYHKIVVGVIGSIGVTFVLFSLVCLASWGDEINTPLITDKLEGSAFAISLKALFCLNVMVSYPFQLFPLNLVIENLLFGSWKKSSCRKWSKNTSRTLIVLFILWFTLFLRHKLDQYVALIGAVSCSPMIFILPSLFHLKACAETPGEKAADAVIALVGFLIMGFCTYLSLANWSR